MAAKPKGQATGWNDTQTARALLVLLLLLAGLPLPLCAATPGAPEHQVRPLRIAVIAARTGVLARPSIPMLRALDMTVQQINSQGGIRRGSTLRRLELVILDSASDPQQAVQALEKAQKDPTILAIVGPADSDSVQALQIRAEALHIPILNATAANTNPPSDYEKTWVFSIGLPATAYFRLMVDEAVRYRPDKRPLSIALAYQDDKFGQAVRKGVMEQIDKYGVALAFSMPMEDRRDLETLRKLLVEQSPSVLFFSANNSGLTRDLLRMLARHKIDLDMVVVSGCHAHRLAELRGLSEYVLCPVQWDGLAQQPDPYWHHSAAFLSAYEVSFGVEPPYQAAQAAAALVVLAQALEKTPHLQRDSIRETLQQTEMSTLFGEIRFGPLGRNVAATTLLEQIRGGSYMTVLPPDRAWIPLVPQMPTWEDRLP